MEIVTKVIFTSALMMGLTGMAYAQSANLGANGTNGLQAGGANGAGAGLGTGAASPSPMPGAGTVGGSPTVGGGGIGSGPVLNNMRANGTSLNMNPNPRAPNLTGKAPGQQ
ncbi:hypothetical protein [Paraburkholderia sp. D1E]|uniref:hypothetical protein n=1 Tax=Paraburkholderia sp. D1E TaxID=3461398 RepID=UPI00404649EE